MKIQEIFCEICEEKTAVKICPICSRAVCEDCWNTEKNCCRICNLTLCEICGKNLAIDRCILCGRIFCRNCMYELTTAHRICISCSKKYPDPQAKIKELIMKISKTLSHIEELS